jgi:amidase
MTITAAAGGPADMVAMRRALEAGETTATFLIDQAIERAEVTNAALNFIASPNFNRAQRQAALPHAGPLAGIPTLIKDMIAEKGSPVSWGAMVLRDYIAAEDEPYTVAIRDAGLVSIGRSTMPEFGLNVVTESPLTGITRNPWNLEHSPGGSSGGGAAAVAAGVVPVAHASDGLGSIRHGAAPCGLVGLKPTRGRNIGDEAMRAISDLGVNGCVSRTVRDTASWLEATQTRVEGAAFPPVPLVTRPVESTLRIRAYSNIMRTGAAPDASVVRVFANTIALMGKLGHSVHDAALPFDGPEAIAMLHDITEGTFSRKLALLAERLVVEVRPDDLEYRSRTLVEAGNAIDDVRYASAWQQADRMVSAYLKQFDEVDIWMTPTLGSEPVRVGIFSPDGAWADQRDHLVDYAGYCWIDNLAGTPSISLPMGFGDEGLPIGVQFATRPGGEALLLALAYQVEAAVNWWRHTPPLWVGDS